MFVKYCIDLCVAVLMELGNSSRSYCELAGRIEPMIGDVILALVGMGFNPNTIEVHAKRTNHSVLPTPVTSAQPKQLSILQAGVKQNHPVYIPTHLPPFPDPHAYIRTPVCILLC